MKNWLLSAGLVSILFCGAQSVQSAPAQELFTKVKVSLGSSNPPSSGSSNSTPSANLSWRNRWLVISVDYTPVPLRKERYQWIDDVSLEILAIFNGQSGGRTQPIIFGGKSVFLTVPLDNRKHVATMMVPPQLLDRYLPSSGAGSTVSPTGTFTIEATFRDRAGNMIGMAYTGQRGWSNDKYATYFSQIKSGSFLTIPGAVYPRSETPWAFQNIDNYDLLKPSGGGGALR